MIKTTLMAAAVVAVTVLAATAAPQVEPLTDNDRRCTIGYTPQGQRIRQCWIDPGVLCWADAKMLSDGLRLLRRKIVHVETKDGIRMVHAMDPDNVLATYVRLDDGRFCLVLLTTEAR